MSHNGPDSADTSGENAPALARGIGLVQATSLNVANMVGVGPFITIPLFVAAMRGPLPVYIADPVARLLAVKEAMSHIKESKQAVGAEVLTSVQNFAPPTILAQASRLNFSTRLFNLIVTNVPGPQFPLYVYGREVLDVFPVAFLPKRHGLAVAIISYNGGINFGLLGDLDALPDIDVIADGVREQLAELTRLAEERREPSADRAAAPA